MVGFMEQSAFLFRFRVHKSEMQRKKMTCFRVLTSSLNALLQDRVEYCIKIFMYIPYQGVLEPDVLNSTV